MSTTKKTQKRTGKPASHLIKRHASYGLTNSNLSLTGFLSVVAAQIEDALLQSGAKAGVDYTRLDLFKLANPYALQLAESERLEIDLELVPDDIE